MKWVLGMGPKIKIMLKNYFKIAIRNLSKHPLFSFINIFGLALGMCIGLLVILRLQDEFSYDRFHPAPGRTFRIISDVINSDGGGFRLASTPLPLAGTLKDNYAFVENTAQVYPGWNGSGSAAGKNLEVNMAFTQPSFFEVFGFKLQQGSGYDALNGPNKIVISERTAKRFFGSAPATGKILALGDLGSFIVTGVITSGGHKSHIDFDIYCSISSLPALEMSGKLKPNTNDWSNVSAGYTYVLLKEGSSKKQLMVALDRISAPLKASDEADKSRIRFDVQSLTAIAPGEDLGNAIGRGASIGKIAAEVSIAFIILISACFNYTNLSIARSLKRAKEVGIRKISGALRSHIFLQFLVESMVIAVLALGLAYLMLEFLKNYTPLRAEFFPEGISMNVALAGWFLSFSLFSGLLAGIVPALALSVFKPVTVLKNLANVRLFGRNGLRKALVVFQFSLSLFIIIFLLVFEKQFNYMATADYGFNPRGIVNIPLNGMDYRLLKTELSGVAGVERVSAASGNLGWSATGSVRVKQQARDEAIYMRYFDVDEDFAKNMELKFLAGSGFGAANSITSNKVLVNETALSALNIHSAADAVGATLLLDDSSTAQVAGVLKDFHFEGFEYPVAPLVFRNREPGFRVLNVKVNTDELHSGAIIPALQSTWKKIRPNDEFSYSWFSREFYEGKAAASTVSMLSLLAFMGVTIASLGLLGMVVYTVEGRTREVSIRKVMGASSAAIAALLSSGFLRLIIIAILIAAPLGWIGSYVFLQMFAVRVSMGAGILIIACGSVLLLAFFVIGSQVLRVANSNPAGNLRME